MGYYLVFGRWTRLSWIRNPRGIPGQDKGFDDTAGESLLLDKNNEILFGLTSDQTIWINANDDFQTEQYFDLFSPQSVRPFIPPTGELGDLLVLETSSHCWALSPPTLTFEPSDIVIEWLGIALPAAEPIIVGQPFVESRQFQLVWPPYRMASTNTIVVKNTYGIYPSSHECINDIFGRSIAPEYPEIAHEILNWRAQKPTQAVWVCSAEGWSEKQSKANFFPSVRSSAVPTHPETEVLRTKLQILYESLLSVGIFGQDIGGSWAVSEMGITVYDYVEERLSELGPILGISRWQDAAICWSGTYCVEDDEREDAAFAMYDPDNRVADMTDRICTELVMPLEATTRTEIYFDAGKRSKLSKVDVATHIVRFAPKAGLHTYWDGDPNRAVTVQLAGSSA